MGRRPSGTLFTALGKFSSNDGHPHLASNLLFEEKSGALHFLQMNVPSS